MHPVSNIWVWNDKRDEIWKDGRLKLCVNRWVAWIRLNQQTPIERVSSWTRYFAKVNFASFWIESREEKKSGMDQSENFFGRKRKKIVVIQEIGLVACSLEKKIWLSYFRNFFVCCFPYQHISFDGLDLTMAPTFHSKRKGHGTFKF